MARSTTKVEDRLARLGGKPAENRFRQLPDERVLTVIEARVPALRGHSMFLAILGPIRAIGDG